MKRFKTASVKWKLKKKTRYRNYNKNWKLPYRNKIQPSKKASCRKLLNMRNPNVTRKLLMLVTKRKLTSCKKIINNNWRNWKMSKKRDWKRRETKDKFWKMKKKNFKEIMKKSSNKFCRKPQKKRLILTPSIIEIKATSKIRTLKLKVMSQS